MSYANLSQTCIIKHWRGYDVRLHPWLQDNDFDWEPELAVLDTWIEKLDRPLPPVERFEIHPSRMVVVFVQMLPVLLLKRTEDGLVPEEP